MLIGFQGSFFFFLKLQIMETNSEELKEEGDTMGMLMTLDPRAGHKFGLH